MREGDMIAHRYRIGRRAGAGGMGTVYEAFDEVSRLPVALKTWRSDPRLAPRASRLWREAHALADIRHPAVVRYVDHGTTPEYGPFLVMSWVAGETLSERLSHSRITPADALRLTERLASGLAAMHARGVVHRDLKPSNIMLPGSDVRQAVIVDLGIARVARLPDTSGVAAKNRQLGTTRYMAPEQIRNARTVDGRADVFALGCVLFEALTGRPAFEGRNPMTIVARILFESLPVLSAVRADMPAVLDQLVAAMLEREVHRRPPAGSARELVAKAEATLGADVIARLAAAPLSGAQDATDPASLGLTLSGDLTDEGSAAPSST